MIPDKIYCWSGVLGSLYASPQKQPVKTEEYIRKDYLLEWVKLAYGKLSMNPFDVQDVFEELNNKLNSM